MILLVRGSNYVGDEQGNFSWQNTYPTEEEVKRSRIQETDCSMPWVFKKRRYLLYVGTS